MGTRKAVIQLEKLLKYILERRPDEFGLVTSPEGFVKIKDLLKAIGEDASGRSIRRSDIDEVGISCYPPPFEIQDNWIRGRDRTHLPRRVPAANGPKVLFAAVRQKAYYHILEKGLTPSGRHHVILAANRDMALRLGKRIDPEPLIVAVNLSQARQKGVRFYSAGKDLFCADAIPAGCYSLPAPPRESPPEPVKKGEKKPAPQYPGSYHLDLDHTAGKQSENGAQRGSPPPGKKKHPRKRKRKRERPPWRQ
jgi:putative RNA 2'-phosphotransferase